MNACPCRAVHTPGGFSPSSVVHTAPPMCLQVLLEAIVDSIALDANMEAESRRRASQSTGAGGMRTALLQRHVQMMCRRDDVLSTRYPPRAAVPLDDAHLRWDQPWAEYDPPEYTDPKVRAERIEAVASARPVPPGPCASTPACHLVLTGGGGEWRVGGRARPLGDHDLRLGGASRRGRRRRPASGPSRPAAQSDGPHRSVRPRLAGEMGAERGGRHGADARQAGRRGRAELAPDARRASPRLSTRDHRWRGARR